MVDWPDRGYRWSCHSCQWQSQISRLFSLASSSPILLPPPQQQQLPLWRQFPVSPLMTLMWMQTFAAAKTQLPIYSSTNEHSRWSPKFNDNPLGQWAMIWSSLHSPWSGFGFPAEFPKKTHFVQNCERFLKTGDQQRITIHRPPSSCFLSVLQALTKHAHFARGFLHTHYTHDCPGHPCKHFTNLSAPLPPPRHPKPFSFPSSAPAPSGQQQIHSRLVVPQFFYYSPCFFYCCGLPQAWGIDSWRDSGEEIQRAWVVLEAWKSGDSSSGISRFPSKLGHS